MWGNPHCGNCRQRRQRLLAAEVGARVFAHGERRSANLPDLVGHVLNPAIILGKTPRGHQTTHIFTHMFYFHLLFTFLFTHSLIVTRERRLFFRHHVVVIRSVAVRLHAGELARVARTLSLTLGHGLVQAEVAVGVDEVARPLENGPGSNPRRAGSIRILLPDCPFGPV